MAIIPGKGSSLLSRRWFFVYPSLFFIQRRGEEGGESNRKGKQNKGAKKKVMCTQGGIEKLSSTVLQLPAYFQTKK